MSSEFLTSFLFTCIISITFSLNLILKPEEKDRENRPRYLPDLSNTILPFFLVMVFLLGSITEGTGLTLEFLLSICFTVFLHISIYYLILIAILPVLRKHISARACYMLWLIPNYLYITWQSFMTIQKPGVVITLHGNTVWILFFLWASGFTLVFVWNIVRHLFFRRKILKNAREIRNPHILTYWERELDYSRTKYRKYKLVTSSEVRTPLSIGLFHRTIHVVLPHKDYTEEEFSLIFRHELVHICREDCWTKFFLLFCTAVCWFNPLMWYAMKKSAEDIELTCDEFVLQGTEDETRKNYASLILGAAGDERGFTTCLSASAKTLRYRLKNITNRKKTYSGGIIVGIITFLLFISCGYVALAYGTYTGEELIYHDKDYNAYHIEGIRSKSDSYDIKYGVIDETAFYEYLKDVSFVKLTGNYSFSENERELFIDFTTMDHRFIWVTLSDRHINIVSYENDYKRESYYLSEPTDWDYLDTILMEYPSLEVHLYQDKNETPYGSHLNPALYRVYRNSSEILYDLGVAIQDTNGIYGYSVKQMKKADLSFSQTPVNPFRVIIESHDGLKRTELSQENLTEPDTIPLVTYDASYMITADFRDIKGEMYTAEFVFNIGDLVE